MSYWHCLPLQHDWDRNSNAGDNTVNEPNGVCPEHLAKGHQPSWQHHERSPACWGQPVHGIHTMGFNGYMDYPQLYQGNTNPRPFLKALQNNAAQQLRN